MRLLKSIFSPFAIFGEKETYQTLFSRKEWEQLGNELKAYAPKPKREKLKDFNSRTFIRAWNKALEEEELFGIPIEESLIETWEKGEAFKLENTKPHTDEKKQKKKKKKDTSHNYDNYDNYDNYNEDDTYTNDEDDNDEKIFSTDERGIRTLRKPTPKKTSKKAKITKQELERVIWAVEKVGKLKRAGEINYESGVRSVYIRIRLEDDYIGKANNDRVLDTIRKSCTLTKNIMAKVILDEMGDLAITLTRKNFEPIYTEHYLHKLKKSGDFILGEVSGKIRTMNILKMVQAHLMVVGGSNSGKSFFLNSMVQSLIHSSPDAEFHLFSPKDDDKGGDFNAFKNYPQVKTCEVMGYEDDSMEKMLDKVIEVLTDQIENKIKRKKGTKIPLQFIFIDEFAYLTESDKVSRPKAPKDGAEQWEFDAYESDMENYHIETKKKQIIKLITNFARLGRKVGAVILGTQVMSKDILGNQAWGNFNTVSFRTSKAGILSGFNKQSENLLPRGDGLVVDPESNAVLGFQSTLATP